MQKPDGFCPSKNANYFLPTDHPSAHAGDRLGTPVPRRTIPLRMDSVNKRYAVGASAGVNGVGPTLLRAGGAARFGSARG